MSSNNDEIDAPRPWVAVLRVAALALLFATTACVGGSSDSRYRPGPHRGADAGFDTGVDVSADTGADDWGYDAADAEADARGGAGADTTTDVLVDAGPDTPTDAGPDTAADARPDTPRDAAGDRGDADADAGPDVGTDAAADTGSADAGHTADASVEDAPPAPTLGVLSDWNDALRYGCDGVGDDDDGDGLFTSSDPAICPDVEAFLGTDPMHADSDRDAVSDYLEVFGDGVFDDHEAIPDRDGDGIIAALDVDDDGDSEHDGLALDADHDGIANFLEVYGYEFDALANRYSRWDGDPTADYFKSDPLQPSSDQDPYPDGMEVSGVLMDPTVATPGDHPMLPGYPNIVVSLAEYDVTLEGDITYTDGARDSRGSEWTSEVSSSYEISEELNWEVGVEVSGEIGLFGGVSASVSASVGGRQSNTYTRSAGRSRGATHLTETQWSRAISSNPSETARIALNLLVENVGTSTASRILPTITLRIGERSVATFEPGGPLVDILEPGGVYPAAPGVYWVVDRRASGEPIFLTMDELRALESGAPLSIEVTQLAADVTRQTAEGSWADIGTWSQYMARIEAVSAHIALEGADGRMTDAMVYADDGPTSPVVTLRDALIWGAGAYDDPVLGTSVRFPDGFGGMESQPLAFWFFNFDSETFERLFELRVADPDYNLFDLPLGPDSFVVAKAPPAEPQPVIEWVAPNLANEGEVVAWISDEFFSGSRLEVELVLDGGTVTVPMSFDPARGAFVAYVDTGWLPSEGDRIIARNPFYRVAEDASAWISEAELPLTALLYAGTMTVGGPGCPIDFGTNVSFLDEACGGAHGAIRIATNASCPSCGPGGSIRSASGEATLCTPEDDTAWGDIHLSSARECSDWDSVLRAADGSFLNLALAPEAELIGLTRVFETTDAEGNPALGKFRILDVPGFSTWADLGSGPVDVRQPFPILVEYVVWADAE